MIGCTDMFSIVVHVIHFLIPAGSLQKTSPLAVLIHVILSRLTLVL